MNFCQERVKRVERGMALLDRIAPGWEERIDLRTLDINNGCFCILGQLYGEYTRVINSIAINEGAFNPGTFAQRHGFLTNFIESGKDLNDAWKVAIRDLVNKMGLFEKIKLSLSSQVASKVMDVDPHWLPMMILAYMSSVADNVRATPDFHVDRFKQVAALMETMRPESLQTTKEVH
jgi:hypothetical protein